MTSFTTHVTHPQHHKLRLYGLTLVSVQNDLLIVCEGFLSVTFWKCITEAVL